MNMKSYLFIFGLLRRILAAVSGLSVFHGTCNGKQLNGWNILQTREAHIIATVTGEECRKLFEFAIGDNRNTQRLLLLMAHEQALGGLCKFGVQGIPVFCIGVIINSLQQGTTNLLISNMDLTPDDTRPTGQRVSS